MASTAPPDAYWTCEQLAAHLQVPLATIYRWRHLGTGPRGIRVGKHVRFHPQEIERWLDAQADPAQPRAGRVSPDTRRRPGARLPGRRENVFTATGQGEDRRGRF